MRTRASPGAVIHTCGSSSVPGPISRRPSCSASSTLPCTGQRANASRRASSQCRRARFQGSAPRSYQRHFCHHSRACRASMRGSWRTVAGERAASVPLLPRPGSPAVRVRGGRRRGSCRGRTRLPLVAADDALAAAHLRALAPDEHRVVAGAAVDRDLGADDGEDASLPGPARTWLRPWPRRRIWSLPAPPMSVFVRSPPCR